MKISLSLFLLLQACFVFSQNIVLDTIRYTVHDAEVDVQKVCDAIGIKADFVLLEVNRNIIAEALMYEGKRAIAFNPYEMDNLRDKNVHTTLAVMAHEVYHHLNADVTSNQFNRNRMDMELRADYGAGVVFGILQIPLQDAKAVFDSMTSRSCISKRQGNARITHPHPHRRKEAIEKGYFSVAKR